MRMRVSLDSELLSLPHLPFCRFTHFLSTKPASFPLLPSSSNYSSLQTQLSLPILSAGITISLLLLGLVQELPWPLQHRLLPLTRRPNPSPCCSFAWAGAHLQRVSSEILSRREPLIQNVKIDSAGTIDYHEGNLADPRMRAASKRRGIEITSISRPIRPSDFRDFDVILAMDKQNREDILEAFNRWKFRETLPDDAHKRVGLMCSYCKKHYETEVPDPYHGGSQGYKKVLDLFEDACNHCWTASWLRTAI